jgi:hypothetical protein
MCRKKEIQHTHTYTYTYALVYLVGSRGVQDNVGLIGGLVI